METVFLRGHSIQHLCLLISRDPSAAPHFGHSLIVGGRPGPGFRSVTRDEQYCPQSERTSAAVSLRRQWGHRSAPVGTAALT
jgi:hypothetical protein